MSYSKHHSKYNNGLWVAYVWGPVVYAAAAAAALWWWSLQTKVDEKLDTRRAIVVVETILSHFSERRQLISDYYEQWKVHVVSGKEFKSQWQQFVQNARKVNSSFCGFRGIRKQTSGFLTKLE